MRVNTGHHLIRIALLTEANFGTSSGLATIDSPTQIDAWHGLPFIPNSALRGVLKDWWRQFGPSDIQTVFGLGDGQGGTPQSRGNAGQLVIGNGDLLTFPALDDNGQRFHVFPLSNLWKFVLLDALPNTPPAYPGLSRAFFRDEHRPALLSLHGQLTLSFPFSTALLDSNEVPEEVEDLVNSLRRWCGPWLPVDTPFVIAQERIAATLWRRSAQLRTQTALDKERKTAKGGSLRRIETIPEGSVFLSLVSWEGSEPLNLQLPVLQFGAEEACGLGFCLLENIEDTTNQNSISEHDAREPGTFEHYEEHREMILAWRAITELREKPSEFQSKARSAINDFGSRVKNEGLEAALGFSLAKARPRSREDRKPEAAAHYWLLESLFREAQPPRPISTCHEWFNTPFSAREISRILSRWQWLRKFSEAILARRGQGNVEPEEVITNSD